MSESARFIPFNTADLALVAGAWLADRRDGGWTDADVDEALTEVLCVFAGTGATSADVRFEPQPDQLALVREFARYMRDKAAWCVVPLHDTATKIASTFGQSRNWPNLEQTQAAIDHLRRRMLSSGVDATTAMQWMAATFLRVEAIRQQIERGNIQIGRA